MDKKILIIEDDKEMCLELSEALTDSGFYVQLANDGLTAKKNIQTNHYDAIILDLKIPKLDGYQLLKYISKNKIDLKIIVITSRMQIHYEDIIISHREQEENDLLMLADSVLIKPFNLKELINKLKK